MWIVLAALACGEKESEVTCEVNGVSYNVGDSWDAGDGCNTCSCDESGYAGCTEMGCVTPDEPDSDTPDEDSGAPAEPSDSPEPDDASEPDASEPDDSTEPLDCYSLTTDVCSTTPGCEVITASPVMYTADECYVWANTVDNVGCMPAGMACNMAFTYSRQDRNSDCYGFTNGCTPAGWVDCDPSNAVECP